MLSDLGGALAGCEIFRFIKQPETAFLWIVAKKKRKKMKKAEGGKATPSGEEAPPTGDTSGILLSLRWASNLSCSKRQQTLIFAVNIR